MKIRIDVITGFLDSGKTTYINELLQDTKLSKEKTVIVQLEFGEVGINDEFIAYENIFTHKLEKEKQIDSQYIEEIIKKYSPQRIIIENNGMKPITTLLEVLEGKALRRSCVISSVINTIDVFSFDIYMNNMGALFIEQISNSDLIVLNKAESFSEDRLENIEKTINSLNKSADIIKSVIEDDAASLKPKKSPKRVKIEERIIFLLLCIVSLYFLSSILRVFDLSMLTPAFLWMQTLNTVFLSILMQAFPFILIGVFVSSILQVSISNETLIRMFPKKMGLGFVVAILSGVLFPVCDCAIVPVAARLIKKGVPLPVATTFMLSAPLVNPIVIASTLYAFPSQPYIALLRVFAGIAIAIMVGASLIFFPEKKAVSKTNSEDFLCSCEYCNGRIENNQGLLNKLLLIFRHAGSEFFEVGKYLIIGAFLSSVFQIAVPKDIFNNLVGKNAISLLVMMLAAFVFSVCSTSDAFIARTFTNQFSTGSILGFLVLGPMIDIKNMLMLLSSFRKGFVTKLVIFIFTFAFLLLIIISLLLTLFT